MKPDGSDVRRLTNNDVSDIDPTFSPDGTKIAFSSAQSSSAVAVHTMSLDGTGVRRVLFLPGQSTQPSWSPDGANIVFMDGSRGGFEISRANVATGAPTPLTTNPAIDGLPSWSPDGSKIAFDSTRPSPPPPFQVYTMSATTGEVSGVAQLTASRPADPTDSSFSPQWSPDGARIVFLADRDGSNEVYSMRSDGTDQRRLTFNDTDHPATTQIDESEDLDPAYSPDGTKIVFESARSGDYEAYTMSAADGSDLRRLTNSPGFDGRCEWQAVRPATTTPRPPTPPVYPKPPPAAGKLKTSLTLKAKPKRDRRLPFKYRFTGRVRIPAGTSKAAVCSGRVKLTLKKATKTVARGTAKVSKSCTYKKTVTISTTARTGARRGKLKVGARFGGNTRLKGSKKSTAVRFF